MRGEALPAATPEELAEPDYRSMRILDELEELVERVAEAGMAPQEAALGRDDGDPRPAAAGPASAAREQPSQERPGAAPMGKNRGLHGRTQGPPTRRP